MGCHVILKLKPCLKSSTSKFTCPCAGVNSNPLPAVSVVFGNGQQEDWELLFIASTVSPHLKVQEKSECLAIILQKLTVGLKDNGQKLQVEIYKTLECVCLRKHSYVYSNYGSCLLLCVCGIGKSYPGPPALQSHILPLSCVLVYLFKPEGHRIIQFSIRKETNNISKLLIVFVDRLFLINKIRNTCAFQRLKRCSCQRACNQEENKTNVHDDPLP